MIKALRELLARLALKGLLALKGPQVRLGQSVQLDLQVHKAIKDLRA